VRAALTEDHAHAPRRELRQRHAPEEASLIGAPFDATDRRAVDALRFLAVDAVERARSGHPGLPLGAAPMAYVLWSRFLKHAPTRPRWPDRDRFVLSAGHGSALLYALLHLTGYDVSLDDLTRFRRLGSRTPGHPERGHTPGVEVTTGPLGQGFGDAVGLAMAEAHLAARFDRPGFPVVDHATYVLASDGDVMEGVGMEAASLAGHLRLGKLVVLYDDNRVLLGSGTDLAFSEDRARRFETQGWHALVVDDGNDLAAIEAAIAAAKGERARPSIVIVRTRIGYGSPVEGTFAAHGAPLGEGGVRAAKERLGWPADARFFVPCDVLERTRMAVPRGEAAESAWRGLSARYADKHPDLARELERRTEGALPAGWERGLPTFAAGREVATRSASGEVLQVLARSVPELVGGSADLDPSTKTALAGEGDFGPPSMGGGDLQGAAGGGVSYAGRNLHFGLREHAMGCALAGLAAHGGVRPFGATFLAFSDYLRPPIRLLAMMRLGAILVFSHDSLAVGEDGPTHQPVEQLASLRAIPGLVVLRPCDANETVVAWRVALEESRPVALVLTRQGVPTLDREALSPADGLRRGAYVLSEPRGAPAAIAIASGSEVHLALGAAERLERRGIGVRVVSMPSMELFAEQPPEVRAAVLPARVRARLSIEAASPFGWRRWVGDSGDVLGVDRFGDSAPGDEVLAEHGFTVEGVCARLLALVERSAAAPPLARASGE
jgi:transketolase